MWPSHHRQAACAAALAVLLATALPRCAALPACGALDSAASLSTGKGLVDDAPALAALDADSSTGLIYLRAGSRHLVASDLTLAKPLWGEAGASLLVLTNATLVIQAQPEHPLAQLFDVGDGGRVVFGSDTLRIFPEWFGAAGNGRTDDSRAVQLAADAAAASGAPMLYLQGVYGLGSEVVFGPGASVVATPKARFISVGGNPSGVTLSRGGFPFQMVLPHLSGFAGFCLRLLGADLASLHLQTLSGCGDAIRLELAVGPEGSSDASTVLDNTIWFGNITDSQIGIAIRAGPGCVAEACVLQGNLVRGRSISGCGTARGLVAAIGWFGGSPTPAWDANQFDIGSITPCGRGKHYAMWHAAPNATTASEVLKVGSGSIHLQEAQPEGAGALRGLAALVDWSGQTTPLLGHKPILAATRPGSKAAFNGGRSLLGNFFTLRAVPDADWPPGGTAKFYVYHQAATGELCHIKCGAEQQPGSGLPLVACTQVRDNSALGGGAAVADEIELTLINLSGSVIRRDSKSVVFRLAVATMGVP
ncbi:Glucan 1,3-beta-glucosidase isoform A [Chlorella sorokiniana]|uniref:Glucan 1,3-beta-glucosidase isoform A n=1 Tax=Chlorella sorokiniana TaxID=3076 RepID=A0A2P6TS26_CHLSO|nr:Glucan 1,3-beta-glucosidase isoform B [Chlorella sorokiniana]PRW56863.1 Glucan 1,3-beta-glucosidase isoform A [Chlorella sorokiniana]|eukprot:PRW56862.1 Glucan 1,3-beta-glucosidase isoform B [Chlorella sorokiniana]